MIYWICYILVWLPLNILFPTRLLRRKNLPKNKPIIIACNHLCNMDPVLIQIKCARKIYFLAKKELFKNKFASFFLRQFGAIKIDRENVGIAPIKEIISRLKQNKTVCIFPQGTRKNDPHVEPENVKDGVAMFSMRTNTPVVPMAIFKRAKPFQLNTIKFGDMIYPDQQKSKDKDGLIEYSIKIANAINALLPKQAEAKR